MVCWDVQDACVSWWESYFNFSFLFFFFFFFSSFFLFYFSPPPGCVGMFCRPVGPTGNLIVGILQRIIFFFFSSPRHPAFVFFSPRFWLFFVAVSLLWYCQGRDRSPCEILSPSTCCILWFLFVLLTKSSFHFPRQSQFKVVCLLLDC